MPKIAFATHRIDNVVRGGKTDPKIAKTPQSRIWHFSCSMSGNCKSYIVYKEDKTSSNMVYNRPDNSYV